MRHKGTVRIETERLILRRFQREDAEAVFRNYESDARMTEFLRWKPAKALSEARAVVEEWVDSYDDPAFYQWAIELKSLGEPVGTISVVGRDERTDTLHIGYCVGSRWWRRGIATEAFSAIIPFLFREVEANRIEAQHDPKNPNSGAVMRKCGLKYEGTLRQADWSNRGIVDACMYSLLRAEWEQLNG